MKNFEEVLSHYGFSGEVIAVHEGPLLKQIEFLPAAGSKVKNIEAVLDDIARELGVSSLRVEMIEGTNHLGFEVPQDEFKTVDFNAIMEQAGRVKGDLPICLGADILGRPVFTDLAKMPHLLVGGTTGSGKSVGLNTFILSLMQAKKPNELKFIMVDPKRIEFSVYNNQKYMGYKVITESDEAVQAIAALVDEMERRYGLLEKSFTKNIKDYNEQTEEKILPYIVCVIDEFADLMATDKQVEKNIQRLAQKARACGIHLILATQRPSVDVVTGVLKANFPTRLAYKVASQADSRTILDGAGAEKLIGRGDALFLAGDGKLQRIHGAYLPDNEIKKIVDEFRGDFKPIIEPKKKEEEAMSANGKGKAVAEKKKEGWFKRFWRWWCNLGVRQRKVIVNGIIYLFNMALGAKVVSSTTKKRHQK